MKTIQITITEPLLAALDRALKGKTRRRSAFIRHSIASQIKRLDRKTLEEIDREGYRRNPVLPGEFELAPEDMAWGDGWKPKRKQQGRR